MHGSRRSFKGLGRGTRRADLDLFPLGHYLARIRPWRCEVVRQILAGLGPCPRYGSGLLI